MTFKRAGGQALILMLLGGAAVLMIANRLPIWWIFWILVAALVVLVIYTIRKGLFVGPNVYARHLAQDASIRFAKLKADALEASQGAASDQDEENRK